MPWNIPVFDSTGKVKDARVISASDFTLRASGPCVVWYHDFDSADEVDAFRWCGGYSGGNDPDDAGNTRPANTVEWQASGGYGNGAFMQLSRAAGTSDGKDWWRPMSPLNTGSGKAVNDPALAGNLTVRTWAPTDGGSQTSGWQYGHYGPESEDGIGGPMDGYYFYLQIALRVTQARLDESFNGGKIQYLTRTEQSLTAQEYVTYYKNASPSNFSIYKGGSPEVSSTVSLVPHVAGEWIHFLYRVVAGDEFGGNSQIEVWRVRKENNETTYTKIFENLADDTNYENSYTPKAWNALILSTYHNGGDLVAFTQDYDEVIFSQDWIVEPGIHSTALYAACDALTSGQSADFTAGIQTLMDNAELEWQTAFYHDPIHHRVHLLGKQAGDNPWPHQYYDVVNETWVTVSTDISVGADNRSGHIYGATTINPLTGDLFQLVGSYNSDGNRRPYKYTPSSNSWAKIPSTNPGSGAMNDTNNGMVCHPQLYGPNRPGLIQDQQISTQFVNIIADSWEQTAHGSNAYGRKEAGGVYWPYHNLVLLGNSAEGSTSLIVTPNAGGTPTSTAVSGPPIDIQGASQQNGSNFGSVHVHPGNPAKLLLLETTGQRAWTGTWNGTAMTWTQISNHPFDDNARVICALRGLGCMWCIGNSTANGNFSVLWRPPI